MSLFDFKCLPWTLTNDETELKWNDFGEHKLASAPQSHVTWQGVPKHSLSGESARERSWCWVTTLHLHSELNWLKCHSCENGVQRPSYTHAIYKHTFTHINRKRCIQQKTTEIFDCDCCVRSCFQILTLFQHLHSLRLVDSNHPTSVSHAVCRGVCCVRV